MAGTPKLLSETARESLRTCIGCRQKRAPLQLLRIAIGPAGTAIVSRTAAGRGAWVCPTMKCAVAADRSAGAARTLRVDRLALGPNPVQTALGDQVGQVVSDHDEMFENARKASRKSDL